MKIPEVKAEIARLSEESKDLRSEIKVAEDAARLQELRSWTAQKLRVLYLVYGYLRGIPYERIEVHTLSNPPFGDMIRVLAPEEGSEKERVKGQVKGWLAAAREYLQACRERKREVQAIKPPEESEGENQ